MAVHGVFCIWPLASKLAFICEAISWASIPTTHTITGKIIPTGTTMVIPTGIHIVMAIITTYLRT